MSDTSTPVPKGKKTFYPYKVQDPVTCNLTKETRDDIHLCMSAASCSRADLLEHSWRVVRGLPVNKDLAKLLRDVPLPAEDVTPAPTPEAAATV